MGKPIIGPTFVSWTSFKNAGDHSIPERRDYCDRCGGRIAKGETYAHRFSSYTVEIDGKTEEKKWLNMYFHMDCGEAAQEPLKHGTKILVAGLTQTVTGVTTDGTTLYPIVTIAGLPLPIQIKRARPSEHHGCAWVSEVDDLKETPATIDIGDIKANLIVVVHDGVRYIWNGTGLRVVDSGDVRIHGVIAGEFTKSPARWFLVFNSDCFSPPMYLVQASNFEEAIEIFQDSEAGTKSMKIEDEDLFDYDEDNLTYNGNGVPLDTDQLQCWEVTNITFHVGWVQR